MPDVREVHLLRVPEVMDERAGRCDGRGVAIESETFEAVRAELVEEDTPSGFDVERPSVHDRRGHADRGECRAAGDGRCRCGRRRDDLARAQDGELVDERLQTVGADVLSGVELAGRQIEQRDADRFRRRLSAAPDPAVARSATPGATAMMNAGSRASRYPASVNVPGETTRTTSRLTMPLAFRGSST